MRHIMARKASVEGFLRKPLPISCSGEPIHLPYLDLHFSHGKSFGQFRTGSRNSMIWYGDSFTSHIRFEAEEHREKVPVIKLLAGKAVGRARRAHRARNRAARTKRPKNATRA